MHHRTILLLSVRALTKICEAAFSASFRSQISYRSGSRLQP